MEQIVIPDKTFTLYKEGTRTFIHILRDESNADLKSRLTFRQEVLLVNKDTKEEFMQLFWFVFDVKECDRFFILAFCWDKEAPLFFNRKQKARLLARDTGNTISHSADYLSHVQKYALSMLNALSFLFFVNANRGFVGDIIYFYKENQRTSEQYLITDVIRLKTINGEMFEIMSLFPISFYHT
ncbi:MAG: hypothetical protein ABIO57_03445 [Candidatus Paceibacterota bacterium]